MIYDLVGFVIDTINPPDEVLNYGHVSAVTSVLKLSPNIDRMEELVDELFWEDPQDFLEKAAVIDTATRTEYKRLMDFKSKNTWIEKHDIRNNIYTDFMKNCTQYMTTLILNDK